MSTLVYMERLIDNMEDKLTDMQNQNHKLSEEIDQLWEFIFEYALSYAQSHIDHVQFKKGLVILFRKHGLEKEANGLEKAMDKEARLDIAHGPFGETLQD